MSKKSKKTIIIAAVAVVCLCIIGAIGSSLTRSLSSSGRYDEPFDSGRYDSALEVERSSLSGDDYGMAKSASNGAEESADYIFPEAKENQKLIYTGYINIGTDSIKKTYKNILSNMNTYGAFFEAVDESSNYKSMTIRVPQDKFMEFYDALSEVGGTITSSNVNVTDATKRYADNQKRIDILETEYSELKEIMEKAKNVEDLLAVRDKMKEVTIELESLKSSNETIDYDAEYATLTVNLSLNGSHDETAFGHKIKEAFSNGLYMLENVCVGLITMWWLILIIVAGIFVWKKKGSLKKKNKESKEITADENKGRSDNDTAGQI